MPELIAKWVSLTNTITSSLTALCVAVAILSISIVVILAIVTHDDKEKASKVKTLVITLGFVSAFAVIGALVSWAMS